MMYNINLMNMIIFISYYTKHITQQYLNVITLLLLRLHAKNG